MSISTKCRKCGRRYRVKDEHAGKKFRCQECQAAVTVPEPEILEADIWETEDSADGFDDDYEDYEDYGPAYAPPPPRRAPRNPRKKTAAKKKPRRRSRRRSSSDSDAATVTGKVAGSIFVGLIVLGAVFRAMNGADFGGGWRSYTTPDGNVTVQMPGKVRSIPAPELEPGDRCFGAERWNFGCAIVIESLSPESRGQSDDEILEDVKVGSEILGYSNVRRSTVNGRPCVTFDQPPEGGVKISSLAFVYKRKYYTLNFAYKSSKGSNEQKFFNSVEFH